MDKIVIARVESFTIEAFPIRASIGGNKYFLRRRENGVLTLTLGKRTILECWATVHGIIGKYPEAVSLNREEREIVDQLTNNRKPAIQRIKKLLESADSRPMEETLCAIDSTLTVYLAEDFGNLPRHLPNERLEEIFREAVEAFETVNIEEPLWVVK